VQKVGIRYYICNLVAQKMYNINFFFKFVLDFMAFNSKRCCFSCCNFYCKQCIVVNYGVYAYFRPCLSDMLSREETYTLIIFDMLMYFYLNGY